MQLVAIMNVKHGPAGETAAPGEAFEVDTDTAKTLIAAGAAATPEDYERAKAAGKPADERLAELETANATLKAELEASAAARATLETENTDLRAQVEDLAKQLEARGKGKGQ